MDLRTQLQDHLGTAFAVERELGGGGMSRVFLAREHRLARQVVIKVLPPELVEGISAERFEREILVAASLQQANIVPVLAVGEVGGLPWFSMPYIEGDSLRSRLSNGPLPISDVVSILRDVTRALIYAHERGIVHRDIKPDNVLISGTTAVVTDFGIAKAISAARGGADRPDPASNLPGTALTSVGTSIGTPAYMAPEQVAGDPNVDHRVDLYALGCLGYELLTGRSPFGDLPPPKMLAAHLSQEPTSVKSLRADCPSPLAALVMQLLSKDPADRPPNATDVLRALDSGMAPATEPARLPRVLVLYALATGAVALLARAAMVGIGLPAWTFTGAVALMLVGLPLLLFTAWAQRTAHRTAVATPTRTPGGSTAPQGTLSTLALRANRHVNMRRTIRGGMLAMGAFVVLVAGFAVTRALGIGPAGSLFAAGTLSADDRVLLADFVVPPDDSALGPIVQEAVRAAMAQSRSIRMVEPSAVTEALQEMERAPGTRLSPDVAQQVAARTGARAILGGRLARAGNGYLVSLELVGTESRQPLASYQGSADAVSDLLGVVDDLSRKLRGKVGESLRQVQRSVPLERATTASLEALRLFTEGSRANDVDREYEKAVRLLREAVAIDSTFALAWRKLAAAMQNAVMPPAVRDSAMDQAVRYIDKLPLRERHLVLGSYYQNHSVHNHRGKALTEYRALYELDSSESVAINQLASLFTDRYEFDSTVRYAKRRFEVQPTVNYALQLASALVLQRRVDEAEGLLDSLRGTEPGVDSTPQFTSVAAWIAYTRGDLEGVRRAVELSEGHVTQLRDRLAAQVQLSVADLIAGKVASAHDRDAEVNRVLATRGIFPTDELGRANADVHIRGKPQDAIARLDRFVASEAWRSAPPSQRPYRVVSLVYAEAGAPAKARRMLELNRQEDPEGFAAFTDHNFKASAEGMILLAEGKPDEALAQFRAARIGPDGALTGCQSCTDYMIARAHDVAGRADSTITWLERYLAEPPSTRFNSDGPFLATVRRRLGELYEQRGERAKAIEQYSAFVSQWEDADPDLQPMVGTVRERLSELVANEGN